MHGVSLSIGSADPLNLDYLARLKRLADEVKPAWITDHLCWTGCRPEQPRSAADAADRGEPRPCRGPGAQVQDLLGRPLILENPSTYLRFAHSTMESRISCAGWPKRPVAACCSTSTTSIVSCFNAGTDPAAYIDAFPCDRVVQIHLAGHQHCGTHIIDTHDRPVLPRSGHSSVWPGAHRRRLYFARMGRRHPALRGMPCRAAEGQALHGRWVRPRARRPRDDGGGADRGLQPGRFPGAEGDGKQRSWK